MREQDYNMLINELPNKTLSNEILHQKGQMGEAGFFYAAQSSW